MSKQVKEPQPVRILFGYLSVQYRGGTKYQLDFARHFRECQVGFLTSNAHLTYEEEVTGIGPLYRLPPTRQFFRRLKALKKLSAEYDVLYLNKATLILPELLLAQWSGFRKVVFHSHATEKECANPLKKKVWNLLHYISRLFVGMVADVYLSCSTEAGKWLFGKRLLPKVQIVRNGVDTERFRFDSTVRTEVRTELRITGPTVINVAAFSYLKNQQYLVEAFAEFHRRQPDAVLLLVGDGECRSAVEEQVKVLGLTDAVRFLGHRSDIERLLNAADIFVLPSLKEGLPFSAVEAQVAGLPCIVTDGAAAETKILPNFQFFDVTQPAEELARAIEKVKTLPRETAVDLVIEAGFDLASCARELEQKLIKTVNTKQ